MVRHHTPHYSLSIESFTWFESVRAFDSSYRIGAFQRQLRISNHRAGSPPSLLFDSSSTMQLIRLACTWCFGNQFDVGDLNLSRFLHWVEHLSFGFNSIRTPIQLQFHQQHQAAVYSILGRWTIGQYFNEANRTVGGDPPLLHWGQSCKTNSGNMNDRLKLFHFVDFAFVFACIGFRQGRQEQVLL